MSDFSGGRRKPVSATDAAFIGFTLARREPLAFLVWALAYLLVAAANIAIQTMLILPVMSAFAKAQADRAATGAALDPATAFAGMGEISRANLIIVAITLVFMAVMNTAVYRALLRPKQRAFGYLRLGLDELRQFVTLLVFWLMMFGVYIVSFIAGIIVAVVLGVTKVGEASGPGRVGMIVAIAACFLLPLLVVGVKLSFAGAMTFAQRRVTLFDSWTATSGRFWTLIGAYVLSFCILIVVGIVVAVAVFAIGAAFSGGFGGLPALPSLKGGVPPDIMRALVLSPIGLTWLLFAAPLGALWLATIAGVPAFIYDQGDEVVDDGSDRSHAFGTPSAPNPPLGEFPITLGRNTPPSDEL